MDLIQAIVLGIVQGLAEFLPISSSGHLIMVPYLLRWPEHSQAFDLALHVGTTVALLTYFWRDWLQITIGFFRGLASAEARRTDERWRMAVLVIVGSVPAGVLGLIAEKPIETFFRQQPAINATLLIVFGLLLAFADSKGRQTRTIKDVRWQDGVLIGLGQAIALFPGVSRSGATLTVGLFRDLDRYSAARFSFLLSGPIIVAAAAYKLRDGIPSQDATAFLVGTAVAAVTGWLAIGFFLKFLTSHSTKVFVIYRVLFGLLVIAVAASRGFAA